MVVAAAARASRLGPLGSRGVTAGPAMTAVVFLLLDGFDHFGRRRSLGGTSFLFRLAAREFSALLLGRFLGLAIVFGPAALFLALLDLAAVFAAASLLERGKPRFLGLAQQLGLHFLARRGFFGGCRLARGGSGGRSRLWRLLGGFAAGVGRRRRRSFARWAGVPAFLGLVKHRIRAALAGRPL